MFTRLRSAWRALVAPVVSTGSPACARCAELERERDYWRAREERTSEAFFQRITGTAGVASPLKNTEHGLSQAIKALGVTSFDPRKKSPPAAGPRREMRDH